MLPPDALDAAVADLADRFRAALEPPRHAGVDVRAEELRARLAEPLPERGVPVESLLAELEDKLAGALPGTTGGRYFGYVTGGVLPGSAIVQAWATAVDQNPGLWALAPGASELDDLALSWLAELIGYPLGSGILTSGATTANLTALAVARHWVGRKLGVDVAVEGVRALPDIAIYGSDELHLSNVKALRTLGLGTASIRRVPLDEAYAMRVDLLAEAIDRDLAASVEPAIVVAHTGAVTTGSSDPLEAIADVCRERGLWLHVDAAWGAFLRVSPRTAAIAAGLERADSVAVDGHKWLNLPNGIGFALLRDGSLHREALSGSAFYLTRLEGGGEDSHERSIEASRNWRGAAVWAALKELGRSGVAELVERCCDLTRELVRLVEASPRLEPTAPAPTVVACFRYRPKGWSDGPELDELNRRIQQELARGGDVYLTGASLPSGFSLRACIVHWRTSLEDVAALVDAVEAAGASLSRPARTAQR